MRRAGHWIKERGPRPLRAAVAKVVRVRNRGRDRHQVWEREIDHEAEYWRRYLQARAGDVPWRLNPSSQVPRSSPLYGVLEKVPADSVTILDVGAGPLTPLGHTFPGKELSITAIDPLAETYDRLLDEAGIEPPVRTVAGEGERLLDLYPPESFDVACAINALDHTYDPLKVVENMLLAVRPGGSVVLLHRANEAEHQLYRGLHQWNFDCRRGDLVIWNRDEHHNVSGLVAGSADTHCVITDGRVVAVMERHGG